MADTRLDIEVPDTVRELIGSVLARLPEEDREVLDLAAVQGRDFDPDLLAQLLGVPRLALLRQLSRLERKHRLIQSRGRMCRFDHQQLQQTLYDELGPEKLLFGSDGGLGHRAITTAYLRRIDRLKAPQEHKAMILGGNALKFIKK
jgi:predicted ATPase